MVVTQPDLANVVGVINWYISYPRWKHWEDVKDIFKYLQGRRFAADFQIGQSDRSWRLYGFQLCQQPRQSEIHFRLHVHQRRWHHIMEVEVTGLHDTIDNGGWVYRHIRSNKGIQEIGQQRPPALLVWLHPEGAKAIQHGECEARTSLQRCFDYRTKTLHQPTKRESSMERYPMH